MRRVNYIDNLLCDHRYASRNLGFAALAILVVAPGIGANTAVFSSVLLQPLAYPDPERIVTLSDALTSGNAPTPLSRQVSIPNFRDWHDQSSSFETMAYYASRETVVLRGGVCGIRPRHHRKS